MRERIYYRPPKHTPLPTFLAEHRPRNHVFKLGAAKTPEDKAIMHAHNQREAKLLALQKRRIKALEKCQEAASPLEAAKAKVNLDRTEAELFAAREDVQLDHGGFLSDDYLP